MTPLRDLRDGLTGDSLRLAIVVGLATVPFTLALSWESISSDAAVSGGPLLLAGLYVGCRYSYRTTETRRAGIWTGLAGSIGPMFLAVVETATTIGSASAEMSAVVAILMPMSFALSVGVAVLVATIGALLADWVAKRIDRTHPARKMEHRRRHPVLGSNWWLPVVAYVLLVPAVLYGLWEDPDGGVGFLALWLAMASQVVLSIVAFVSLLVDVTALRSVETDWIPSVWAYVGAPLGAYAFVYVAATYRASMNPGGDAILGFAAALWVTSVVYLASRYRYTGTWKAGAHRPS